MLLWGWGFSNKVLSCFVSKSLIDSGGHFYFAKNRTFLLCLDSTYFITYLLLIYYLSKCTYLSKHCFTRTALIHLRLQPIILNHNCRYEITIPIRLVF